MGILMSASICCNQMVSYKRAKKTCCANLRDPFMDLSKHLDLGILALIKPLNLMVLINVLVSPMCTKSVMEAWWCS